MYSMYVVTRLYVLSYLECTSSPSSYPPTRWPLYVCTYRQHGLLSRGLASLALRDSSSKIASVLFDNERVFAGSAGYARLTEENGMYISCYLQHFSGSRLPTASDQSIPTSGLHLRSRPATAELVAPPKGGNQTMAHTTLVCLDLSVESAVRGVWPVLLRFLVGWRVDGRSFVQQKEKKKKRPSTGI